MLVPLMPGASASSLPFTDPNANGFIGLCTRSGQPITSGSLTATPFIWTAVSSTPAPDGYNEGKAVLVAYQPRQNVDPGEWSGTQLTASSTFTNAAHPMAQATVADSPLLYFTQAYPPRWDGLIELRMYFSGVNLPVYTTPYPATVIKVHGDRWSVVSGGPQADCTAGHATSIETQFLPASRFTTVPSVATNNTSRAAPSTSYPPSGNTSSASSHSTSASPSGAAAASGSNPAGISAAASGSGGGGPSGSSIAGAVAGGVALVVAGSAGVYFWRRRKSAAKA
jgi:hypothetical protein